MILRKQKTESEYVYIGRYGRWLVARREIILKLAAMSLSSWLKLRRTSFGACTGLVRVGPHERLQGSSATALVYRRQLEELCPISCSSISISCATRCLCFCSGVREATGSGVASAGDCTGESCGVVVAEAVMFDVSTEMEDDFLDKRLRARHWVY